MKIGVVGLGLMGGSIAQALSRAGHSICAADKDPAVLERALADGTIAGRGGIEECPAVFVCITPRAAVDYMLHARFLPGAVVTDICGVKRYVADSVSEKLHKAGVRYVGGHPMAGREVGGYENSSVDLFKGASYILTRDTYTNSAAEQLVAGLAVELGCAHITYSTAEQHDKMVAYTSQLAHAVSNCYVKNPLATTPGYSAGSFLDLTRVARLDAAMWAELFVKNSDFLAEDIENIIEELNALKAALLKGDEAGLHTLLKQGSELRKKISKKYKEF